jgi:hypothetical protein
MNHDLPSIPDRVRTSNLLEKYPLTGFEPHEHDTWLFGFQGTGGIFDPYPELVDMYDDVDSGQFDFPAYEKAVAEGCFRVSMDRLQAVFGDCAPTIHFQKIGGKRRDGLYVQVDVDKPFCRFLRQHILGGEDGRSSAWEDFSAWLERRYKSRRGFHPWHSTDPVDWIGATSGLTDFRGCRQGHKLGAILKFVVRRDEQSRGEEWDEIDVYYAAQEASERGLSPTLFYKESG